MIIYFEGDLRIQSWKYEECLSFQLQYEQCRFGSAMKGQQREGRCGGAVQTRRDAGRVKIVTYYKIVR